ncbi:MAG: PA14 domain-containing protein [Kiritimatiellae bacterium]|jgi:beta-glucanase (GH16 family)|nr:PA14 domain-containing protein [Kiritimatiellia bacterium]
MRKVASLFTNSTLKRAWLVSLVIAVACLFNGVLLTSVQAQDIDLTGYTLTFNDEFTNLSIATSSPKGSATWYAGYPPNGSAGVYGYASRDAASLTVNNGVLSNKLWLKTFIAKTGSYCGGPVGMKNSAGTSLVNMQTAGTQANQNGNWQWYGWTGMKFTVGGSPVTISQLGRYAIPSNIKTHQVRIFDAATGDDVAKAIVNCAGQTGFIYANIIGGDVTLQANHSYHLMTDNYSGADYFYGPVDTAVSTVGGITVNESTWGAWHSGALYSVDSTASGFSQQYGYFEMRTQLPASGTGAWPSFWLKTVNDISHIGNVEEIDIFEWYGNTYSADPQKAIIQEASHNWLAEGGQDEDAPYLYKPYTPMPGGAFPWAGYHIYGFQSDPVYCTWYIDGVMCNRIETPTDYLVNPMFIIMEYSIGGGWPVDGVVANSHYNVDWVRVWSLPDVTPPSVPQYLQATAMSSSQINLSWDASTDPVVTGYPTSGIEGYDIIRGGQWIDVSTSTSYSDTGLSAGTAYTYNVAAFDAADNTSANSAPASTTTQSAGGGGTGTGLKGDYYNTQDLSGSIVLTRTDATVNFDWGGGSPGSGVNSDNFSVHWTGQVQPRYSETYSFYTTSDDGVRLWVNGTLVIDKWQDQGPTEWSGTISLTANQKYDIKMEYYEAGGGAMAKLSWSSASQAKEIAPTTQLYP